MLTPRSTLNRRVLAALDASPSRIPVLVGPCGSGRTALLRQLRDRIGRTAASYIDVQRTASTPERFMGAIASASPFPPMEQPRIGARAAFDQVLTFFDGARAPSGEPATFLLDEFLEVRTFESFPGLRQVLGDLMDRLAASGNRFVLTSRFTARTVRLLRDRSARFELIHMPAMTVEDTMDILGPDLAEIRTADTHESDDPARTVHALADGRPSYVKALVDELADVRHREGPGSPGGSDAISALVALLAPDGRLCKECATCYELRLHRARGYGALKAILEILAEEEDLTLTEISLRLARTPGSTKDYLSWLEDVDLVASRQKRYRFTDPLLRVWVRLHCRASAPTEDDLAREIHQYALPRLPQRAPAFVMAAAGAVAGEDKKPWGIIEID
jgi:hypothetical protein